MDTTFYWVTSDVIKNEHKSIKINQVYVWLLTKDKKIALVSKDGQKWQFPGGHPLIREQIFDTAARELDEELGLDISHFKNLTKQFGYYVVNEPSSDKTTMVDILQIRMICKIDKDSDSLKIHPKEKDTEKEKERINFTNFFTIEEACKNIPWLGKTEELKVFLTKAKLST